MGLSGFFCHLPPLASRGVGLNLGDIPGRGLALFVDVKLHEPVVEPVDVVAGYQGEGVSSGDFGGLGITLLGVSFSACHDPFEDVDGQEGGGRDEENGPVG